MKDCKYRITVQGLDGTGIFICKLLNSPVCCPDDNIKCFNFKYRGINYD